MPSTSCNSLTPENSATFLLLSPPLPRREHCGRAGNSPGYPVLSTRTRLGLVFVRVRKSILCWSKGWRQMVMPIALRKKGYLWTYVPSLSRSVSRLLDTPMHRHDITRRHSRAVRGHTLLKKKGSFFSNLLKRCFHPRSRPGIKCRRAGQLAQGHYTAILWYYWRMCNHGLAMKSVRTWR